MDTATPCSLSDILRNADGFADSWTAGNPFARGHHALLVAEAEWRAAIAALAQLLHTLPRSPLTTLGAEYEAEGIALSGPLPALNDADFGHRLETWVLTPQPLAEALSGQRSLSPSGGCQPPLELGKPFQVLPLNLHNPLLTERFCLVLTPLFSVGLVLGQPTGDGPCLQYSFDPQVLLTLWQHIRTHVSETVSPALEVLDKRVTQAIAAPDYRLITRFTQTLMAHLPHRLSAIPLTLEERGTVRLDPGGNGHVPSNGHSPGPPEPAAGLPADAQIAGREDTLLLQAMAHEIRTPLTTIRTLTRSLLRRQDLSPEVKKRLVRIDEECTQQIDRFNLIFRAVELETMERDRPRSSLAPIALSQIFEEAIPRWQQQAQRRNLSLAVTLPPNLPRVTSDPTLLNEVLAGVVEWFTQCLPPQSHVHMRVMLAGHQLKLQFEAEPTPVSCSLDGAKRQTVKSVGQLLMVVPETGGLSLNLDATKNLFEFLGGKLILRQRPEQGEVLTAFLPLDTREI